MISLLDIRRYGNGFAIGHIYAYKDNKKSRVTFKYRNRTSTFTPQDRIFLHKGLWKALNVNF